MNFFAVGRSAESPSETEFNNLVPVSEGHSAEGYQAKKFISSALATPYSEEIYFVAVRRKCNDPIPTPCEEGEFVGALAQTGPG